MTETLYFYELKNPTSVDNNRQRGLSKANVSYDQLETRSETASKTTQNDSTLNAIFRRSSNRKRKWEAVSVLYALNYVNFAEKYHFCHMQMTTSTPKDEVVQTSNSYQEPVRKRSRKCSRKYTNGSSSQKSTQRMIDANCSRKEVSVIMVFSLILVKNKVLLQIFFARESFNLSEFLKNRFYFIFAKSYAFSLPQIHTLMSNATKCSVNNTGVSSVQNTIDSRVDSMSMSEIPQLEAPTTKTNDSPASRILIRRTNLRRVRQNIAQKRSRQKVSQIVLIFPLSPIISYGDLHFLLFFLLTISVYSLWLTAESIPYPLQMHHQLKRTILHLRYSCDERGRIANENLFGTVPLITRAHPLHLFHKSFAIANANVGDKRFEYLQFFIFPQFF